MSMLRSGERERELKSEVQLVEQQSAEFTETVKMKGL